MMLKMGGKGRRTECAGLFSLISISVWYKGGAMIDSINLNYFRSDVGTLIILALERKGLVCLHHGGNDCGWLGGGDGPGIRDCREGLHFYMTKLNPHLIR